MRKMIFKRAIYIILALSIPAISWSLKGDSAPLISKGRVDSVSLTDSLAVKSVSQTAAFDKYLSDIYLVAGLQASKLDFGVFRKALTGYFNFKASGLIASDKQIVSIVDFNKPSTQKRLWIIDLANKKLLFNTLVAHGQGSGDNMATNFSNTSESHQSSLGFYITDNTYQGKHGLSLKLNGMDKGFNTNALSRAVVLHGAEYVSQNFINQHGRLGRSYGCPALPVELTSSIIQAVKGKTTLFINGPATVKYASAYLDEKPAISQFSDAGQLLAGNM